jgi:hypothetical protein
MYRLLIASALAVAACGGKTKSTSDPTAAACCCASGEGREIVADTVCEERGGTCEPAETCEATDPSPDGDGGGGSDPDDY